MNTIVARTTPPKREEIIHWETQHDFQFSKEYTDFLLNTNGGIPEKKVCELLENNHFTLDFFYEFTEIDEIYSLQNAVVVFKDIFEFKYLPIAREVAGGLVLLDLQGNVFFWDHETVVKKISFIGLNVKLNDFIDSLVEEKAISYGSNIDIIDDGKKEDIIAFLNTGYDVNKPLEIGKTIIQRAALLHKNWLIKELIKRNANLTGTLEECTVKDNIEGFKILLQNGADPNEITSSDYSLLMDLVIAEKVVFIEELMKYNPNTEWRDEYDETALQVAEMKLASGEKIMNDIIKLIKK